MGLHAGEWSCCHSFCSLLYHEREDFFCLEIGFLVFSAFALYELYIIIMLFLVMKSFVFRSYSSLFGIVSCSVSLLMFSSFMPVNLSLICCLEFLFLVASLARFWSFTVLLAVLVGFARFWSAFLVMKGAQFDNWFVWSLVAFLQAPILAMHVVACWSRGHGGFCGVYSLWRWRIKSSIRVRCEGWGLICIS